MVSIFNQRTISLLFAVSFRFVSCRVVELKLAGRGRSEQPNNLGCFYTNSTLFLVVRIFSHKGRLSSSHCCCCCCCWIPLAHPLVVVVALSHFCERRCNNKCSHSDPSVTRFPLTVPTSFITVGVLHPGRHENVSNLCFEVILLNTQHFSPHLLPQL